MSNGLFSLLLKLFPRWFRELYADDMRRDFERHKAFRDRRGRRARWVFTMRALAEIPISAVGVRLRGRQGRPEDGTMGGWVGDFWNETKSAVRAVARRPVFSAVVVSTLALALGANTAVFSLLRDVVLRPLPYDRPGELHLIWETLDDIRGVRPSRSPVLRSPVIF